MISVATGNNGEDVSETEGDRRWKKIVRRKVVVTGTVAKDGAREQHQLDGSWKGNVFISIQTRFFPRETKTRERYYMRYFLIQARSDDDDDNNNPSFERIDHVFSKFFNDKFLFFPSSDKSFILLSRITTLYFVLHLAVNYNAPRERFRNWGRGNTGCIRWQISEDLSGQFVSQLALNKENIRPLCLPTVKLRGTRHYYLNGVKLLSRVSLSLSLSICAYAFFRVCMPPCIMRIHHRSPVRSSIFQRSVVSPLAAT